MAQDGTVLLFLRMSGAVMFGAFFVQAEMERALLQGEREAEHEQIEAESMVINQLQHKLDELENAVQREKDKVHRQHPGLGTF